MSGSLQLAVSCTGLYPFKICFAMSTLAYSKLAAASAAAAADAGAIATVLPRTTSSFYVALPLLFGAIDDSFAYLQGVHVDEVYGCGNMVLFYVEFCVVTM